MPRNFLAPQEKPCQRGPKADKGCQWPSTYTLPAFLTSSLVGKSIRYSYVCPRLCVVFVLIRPLQGRQARFTKFYYVQGAH